MRIAYDHQIFGQQENGGISRYFAELIANLQQHEGVEASVVAPLHMNRYLLKRGVKEHVRGSFFPFKFRGHRRVINAVNSMAQPFYWGGRQFDVVHETLYSNTAGRARARVTTIYDMIHELFPDELPASREFSAAKLAAVKRCDHVICISETTRRDAIRMLDLKPEQTSVIHLGCSFQYSAAASKIQSGHRPYVLYVGSRSRYKNFETLLSAFSRSKLAKIFNLIAFGGGAFTAEEHRKIKQAGVAGAVHQVSGDDVVLANHYRDATAFVYPSLYEGFGFPPLEAMANGCPVVCSTADSIVEIVGDAGAYFDPNNSDDLRAVLERVIGNAELAADLRTRGQLRLQRYSWKKCAEQTLSIYRGLS